MRPTTSPWSRRPGVLRTFQVLWVAGFLVGTVTHVADLVLAGAEVYAGFPTAVRVFWVTLTVADPAVVVLVLLRRRAGVALGVAIMVLDVAVNWTVHLTSGGAVLVGLVNQSVFGALVLLTARPLWDWCGRREPTAVVGGA